MRLSQAAQVGLAVIAAAVLLGYVTFSLRGNLRGGTYLQQVTFSDAQGITADSPVRVRGVELGSVREISLTPNAQALLTLRMRNVYRITPQDAIRIVGGLFSLNPPYIEITPGGRREPVTVAPGQPLPGESTVGTERLLSQSEQLLDNLNKLTVRMTGLADDLTKFTGDPKLQRDVRTMTSNFADISKSGVVIARNMEGATDRLGRLAAGFEGTSRQLDRTLRDAQTLMTRFQGTAEGSQELIRDTRALVQDTRSVVKSSGGLVQNMNEAVKGAGELVAETRGTLAENREGLRSLVQNLNGSLKQLDAVLTETRKLVGDEAARQDFKETLTNLRDATANLKEISKDVRGITGDPEVQENLRGTLGSLKDLTERAGEVLRRAQAVLGGGGKTAKSLGQRVSESAVKVDLLHGASSGRTRLDVDALIPWSKSTYYRIGFYDFGETNKFNLQAGQQLRPGVTGRFGFRAAKLGLGLDIGNRLRPPFSVDIYGVDDPRIDVRANLPISRSLDLTLGFDNIEDRADPVFGVRYHR